jgi:hypothetical protein
MRIKITIAEIIFLLAISYNGAAQNKEIRFHLVKGNNGQPLGKINAADVYLLDQASAERIQAVAR